MSQNLNKMSIQDYFKHLYDHIMNNLNTNKKNTILTRTPILCLNNNKTIGVYDHMELDENSKGTSNQTQISLVNTKNMINNNESSLDPINTILDNLINSNLKRSHELHFKHLIYNLKIDLEWLKKHSYDENWQEYFGSKDELLVAWFYYARFVFNQSINTSNQIEKLLNILSNLLEINSKCELVWLVYLKCYLIKKNSLNDYHEICLLCMDNIVTYDLVWFIVNTCPLEYLNLVFERYEKHLLDLSQTSLVDEFEQRTVDLSSEFERKISFYLLEMILFQVKLTIVNQNETELQSDKKCTSALSLLYSYLNKKEVLTKIEPIDLSALWLCYIHLEAFNSLPCWLNINKHMYLADLNNSNRLFWALKNQKRVFNQDFFQSLDNIYSKRYILINKTTSIALVRNYDVFLLPWRQSQQNSNQERFTHLFHESLKSINSRSTVIPHKYSKQESRLFGLPIFLNMIYFEMVNNKLDVAMRLCERLVKANETSLFKEIWFSLINIQMLNINNNSSNNCSIELLVKTVQEFLNNFSNDPQVVFNAAQFHAQIVSVNYPVQSIVLFSGIFLNLGFFFSKSFIKKTLFSIQRVIMQNQ
jgi:hypothetical protein